MKTHEESAKDDAIEILTNEAEKLDTKRHTIICKIENETQEKIVNVCGEWINLLLSKNKNYGSSVFKVPVLAPDMSVDSAIRVRMSDKIERLTNLLKGDTDKVGESIEDTVSDLGAYCLLWLVAREMSE